MKFAKDVSASSIVLKTQGDRTVSSLLGEMKNKNLSEALVFSEDKLKGVLSHSLLLTSRQSGDVAKVHKFIVPSPRVNFDDDLIKVASYMLDSNSRVLVVFDGEDLLKIVDVFGFLDAIKTEKKLNIKISSLIEEVQAIEEDATLGEALHMMHFSKYKELFVKDDRDEVIGTLFSMNILKTYVINHTTKREHVEIPNTPENTHQTELKDLKMLNVKNFTESSVPIINSDSNFSDVAESFSKNKSSILLVKDSLNDVIGMIRIDMLLKQILNIFFEGVENIFFQGLDELDLDDDLIENIHEISASYAERLQVYFNNVFDLRVHIKEHRKDGTKSRFQIFAKLTYPSETISSVSDDWEIITALRKSLEKIETQLKHKYKDKNPIHHVHDFDVSKNNAYVLDEDVDNF